MGLSCASLSNAESKFYLNPRREILHPLHWQADFPIKWMGFPNKYEWIWIQTPMRIPCPNPMCENTLFCFLEGMKKNGCLVQTWIWPPFFYCVFYIYILQHFFRFLEPLTSQSNAVVVNWQWGNETGWGERVPCVLNGSLTCLTMILQFWGDNVHLPLFEICGTVLGVKGYTLSSSDNLLALAVMVHYTQTCSKTSRPLQRTFWPWMCIAVVTATWVHGHVIAAAL